MFMDGSMSNNPLSPPLTKEYLEAVRRRCREATEGPWTSFIEGRDQALGGASFIMRGKDQDKDDLYLDGGTVADYDFVANARQDIPLLIDEIERLQAELNLLQEETARLRNSAN